MIVLSDGVHLMVLGEVRELHDYCASIGIKRCWYHHSRFPHYDIPKRMRADFFGLHPQVVRVSSRLLVSSWKEYLDDRSKN